MTGYHYKQEKEWYYIYSGDDYLRTPAGNIVCTNHLKIAEQIIHDLNNYGYQFRSADTILSWHFTYLDSFSMMDHERVEGILFQSFLLRDDWTCYYRDDAEWENVFGDWEERRMAIWTWIKNANILQLTAACCIGNAYDGSLNLAITLASIIENFNGTEKEKNIALLARLIGNTFEFGPASEIYANFKTFELYYEIGLEEYGNTVEGIKVELHNG